MEGILQAMLFLFERKQLFQPSCWDRCFLPPLVLLRCSVLRPCCLVPPEFAVVDLGTICRFLCPHRPPMLALLLSSEWHPGFLYVKISQSLMAVNIARSFGCFTALTTGRLDAPRCGCHYLLSATDLPLDFCLLLLLLLLKYAG